MSHELTTFLGDQLRTLAANSGFSITTAGADLVVVGADGHESRNGTAAILDDPDDPRPADERAATAAGAVLGHVQDAISRETGKPWPGEGSELPLPGVAAEDGWLVAWFGDHDTATWPLREVRGARVGRLQDLVAGAWGARAALSC